jgi:hypothetical protein
LVWKGSLSAAQQCTRRERVDRVGLADQQTLDPAIPRLSLPRTKAIKQPLQLNRPGVPYLITHVSLDARCRHPERISRSPEDRDRASKITRSLPRRATWKRSRYHAAYIRSQPSRRIFLNSKLLHVTFGTSPELRRIGARFYLDCSTFQRSLQSISTVAVAAWWRQSEHARRRRLRATRLDRTNMRFSPSFAR